MSIDQRAGLAQVMQVFISSKTSEMKAYRDKAIQAIHDAGMRHKNFNDPGGAGFTQGSKTIFELNRNTIQQSDVFVGLYGVGEVWRPASHPGLREAHLELLENPYKLIMEYEYEWAKEFGLYTFLFMRTNETLEVPFTPSDEQMESFRERLMTHTVGWLTTPEKFYEQLLGGLKAIRPRTFLSYSRRNVGDADDLQQRLRQEDIHAWRDSTSIPGGSEWASVIEKALDLMDALVVVVTPESAKSEWVEKECRTFIESGKPVIPYVSNAASKLALPNYLSSIEYIDGTSSDGFRKLVKQLRAILSS